MTKTRKIGLGRGLDALLDGVDRINAEKLSGNDTGFKILPVDLLERGRYQPRENFDPEALQELANSIRTQGMVQPIVVRALPGGKKFEIIAGERRWRAAQLGGLQEVPVIIKIAPDQIAVCMSLIENIQREDLNPMEEAVALDQLLQEFDMTHEEVASAIGRSRSAVSNLLRLLNLDKRVKDMLQEGKLEMGHARALLSLAQPKQAEVARKIIKKGLTVRETETLVKHSGKSPPLKSTVKIDANTLTLQNKLSAKLGTRVVIRQQSKQKGALQIYYNTLDELDGILGHIK